MNKIIKNLIILLGLVILISVSGYLGYYILRDSIPGDLNILTGQDASQKALDFLNTNLLPENIQASLIEVDEESGLYKFKLELQGQEHISYVSKDGKLFFIEGIDMNQPLEGTDNSGEEEVDVSKQERPDVKLFVMSYCPYGLQAQKMFLPVYELLGDKADMGIYFVNYIMHGKDEIDENLRQYCIQKEQKEKFIDYLSCFVKDGNYSQCLSEAGIDQGMLDACVTATDQEHSIYSQYEDESTWLNGYYPLFNVHDDLNKDYGVQGSPTVVINSKVVSVSPRSPERFKEIICQSFESQPQECSQTLSETAFSPGFGLETGDSSGGGCGP